MKPKNKKSLKKSGSEKSLEKKTLKGLMMDEDGFVSKETILKVGLTTIAGLGVFGAAMDAEAGSKSNHTNHANAMNGSGACYVHSNVTTHTSY